MFEMFERSCAVNIPTPLQSWNLLFSSAMLHNKMNNVDFTVESGKIRTINIVAENENRDNSDFHDQSGGFYDVEGKDNAQSQDEPRFTKINPLHNNAHNMAASMRRKSKYEYEPLRLDEKDANHFFASEVSKLQLQVLEKFVFMWTCTHCSA